MGSGSNPVFAITAVLCLISLELCIGDGGTSALAQHFSCHPTGQAKQRQARALPPTPGLQPTLPRTSTISTPPKPEEVSVLGREWVQTASDPFSVGRERTSFAGLVGLLGSLITLVTIPLIDLNFGGLPLKIPLSSQTSDELPSQSTTASEHNSTANEIVTKEDVLETSISMSPSSPPRHKPLNVMDETWRPAIKPWHEAELLQECKTPKPTVVMAQPKYRILQQAMASVPLSSGSLFESPEMVDGSMHRSPRHWQQIRPSASPSAMTHDRLTVSPLWSNTIEGPSIPATSIILQSQQPSCWQPETNVTAAPSVSFSQDTSETASFVAVRRGLFGCLNLHSDSSLPCMSQDNLGDTAKRDCTAVTNTTGEAPHDAVPADYADKICRDEACGAAGQGGICRWNNHQRPPAIATRASDTLALDFPDFCSPPEQNAAVLAPATAYGSVVGSDTCCGHNIIDGMDSNHHTGKAVYDTDARPWWLDFKQTADDNVKECMERIIEGMEDVVKVHRRCAWTKQRRKRQQSRSS